MYKEYSKFDEPREEFNPPIEEVGHFSNYPDMLVPADFEELNVDPITLPEREYIEQLKTPPSSPPEQDPGRMGCRYFSNQVRFYVDPIYESSAIQRIYATKLVLFDFIYLLPSFCLIMTAVIWRSFELQLFSEDFALTLWLTFGCSALGLAVYAYVVGICRNPPYLYIAFVIRVLLITGVFGVGCLLLCKITLFLFLNDEQKATFHNKEDRPIDETGSEELGLVHRHNPPYMGALIVLILLLCQIINCILYMKKNVDVGDYLIPFSNYTVCYILAPILCTITLNDGFNGIPKGYDVFQVLFACMASAIHLSRSPHFMEKLFAGKICPLTKNEFMYPLLQYLL